MGLLPNLIWISGPKTDATNPDATYSATSCHDFVSRPPLSNLGGPLAVSFHETVLQHRNEACRLHGSQNSFTLLVLIDIDSDTVICSRGRYSDALWPAAWHLSVCHGAAL